MFKDPLKTEFLEVYSVLKIRSNMYRENILGHVPENQKKRSKSTPKWSFWGVDLVVWNLTYDTYGSFPVS